MWRLRLLVSATMLSAAMLLAARHASAQQELPFDAYVVVTTAEVCSSHQEPRYATLSLPRGTRLEVYQQHDEWLGIRPPADSFSWVPSQSMTMTAEPGVAEAAADGVASWIGSSVERVEKHHWAVQLQRGEQVEILGKKEVPNAEGKLETWLKIAPPAGEFRWIHASQVSRDPPSAFQEVARAQRGLTGPNDAGSAWTAVSRPATAHDESRAAELLFQNVAPPAGPYRRSSMELRDLTPPPARQAGLQSDRAGGIQLAAFHAEEEQPQSPPRERSLSPDGFVPRKGGRPASRGLPPHNPSPRTLSGPVASARAQRPAPLPPAAPITPMEPALADPAPPAPGISSAQVQRRLEEIDVSLSLMVSRDRSQWNLPALKRETQQLVENGATAVDRGEARFMLEKIERFAEAFGVEMEDGPLDLPLGSAAARKAALEAATAPKYDGAGYLTAVRAQKPLAPYALLDEQGNHLYYVTPVPGFNLREYEDRKVGIFGKRGYLPSAKAAHLLAERVVDLDKQVR